MKAAQARTILIEIISALFVLLFTYTAIMKLRDIPAFVSNMKQSVLIKSYAGILAWIVPVTEILVSVFLIIPRTRYAGLWSATVLMFLFTTYIGIMLSGSAELPCSCGGIIRELNWREHFVFNLAFLCGGTTAIIFYHKKYRENQESPNT